VTGRRELLEVLCLNRYLDSTSLYLEWRKPVDVLAEQPTSKNGIPTGIGLVPSDGVWLQMTLAKRQRA
jgi:hypothetical protein